MKTLILFFSGTGNTQFIAEFLFRNLGERGFSTSIASIDVIDPEIVRDYDILLLGYSVFETNAPSFVRNFIDSLPVIQNKGTFVFCTKGAVAGNANRRTMKRLMNKGFYPLGSGTVGMPGSDGLSMLKKDSFMVRLVKKVDFDHRKGALKFLEKVTLFLTEIESGTPVQSLPKKVPLSIPGLFLDWLWHLLYQILGKRLISLMRVDGNCTKCGMCVQNCPVENIQLTEEHGIKFLNKCFLCMRCINQCPEEAIQIGKMTVGKFRWKGPKKSYKPQKFLFPVHSQ